MSTNPQLDKVQEILYPFKEQKSNEYSYYS
jgi:hypothetical protein